MKHISLSKGISKRSIEPARIIGIDKGHLSLGADADISIFDLNQKWVVDSSVHFSKGKNCVFNGKKHTGKCIHTIVDGKIKHSNGKITKE